MQSKAQEYFATGDVNQHTPIEKEEPIKCRLCGKLVELGQTRYCNKCEEKVLMMKQKIKHNHLCKNILLGEI